MKNTIKTEDKNVNILVVSKSGREINLAIFKGGKITKATITEDNADSLIADLLVLLHREA